MGFEPISQQGELHGACLLEVVGLEGFEPSTSCSPNTRATMLRYNPKMAARAGFEPATK